MKNTVPIVASVCLCLAAIGTAQAAGDAKLGEKQASSCNGCHGADGRGQGQNPPLAGMKQAYFIQQMNDYKSGARSHLFMQRLAQGLSDQHIANMAAYYASLPPPSGKGK